MHTSADRESLLELAKAFFQRKTVRARAFFFITCLVAYTTVSWALSVIFIAELESGGIDTTGNYSVANIRLPVNIDVTKDTCYNSTGATNCYYDLSVAPLGTLLITQNLTYIAGMRFPADYQGPSGIPFDILDHFVESTQNTTYPDLRTSYCTPRLLPKSYSCKQDVNNSRVSYQFQSVFNEGGVDSGLYRIILDPGTPNEANFPRPASSDGSISSWVIAGSRVPNKSMETIITATGSGAKLLSKMAWLNFTVTDLTEPLTVVCTLNASYTWTWQTFNYENNLYTIDPWSDAEISPLCSNDPNLSPEEYNRQHVPFINIPLAIEGSTDVMGSVTGYSKLLNLDSPTDPTSLHNTTYSREVATDWGMTELELYLSAIYGTVMTMYPSSQDAPRTAVRYVSNSHYYQITVSWTALSILAFASAIFVFVCTVWQTVCWATAMRRLKATKIKERDILKPLRLMAYSAHVSKELLAMMKEDRKGKLTVPKGDQVGLGPTGIVRLGTSYAPVTDPEL